MYQTGTEETWFQISVRSLKFTRWPWVVSFCPAYIKMLLIIWSKWPLCHFPLFRRAREKCDWQITKHFCTGFLHFSSLAKFLKSIDLHASVAFLCCVCGMEMQNTSILLGRGRSDLGGVKLWCCLFREPFCNWQKVWVFLRVQRCCGIQWIHSL